MAPHNLKTTKEWMQSDHNRRAYLQSSEPAACLQDALWPGVSSSGSWRQPALPTELCPLFSQQPWDSLNRTGKACCPTGRWEVQLSIPRGKANSLIPACRWERSHQKVKWLMQSEGASQASATGSWTRRPRLFRRRSALPATLLPWMLFNLAWSTNKGNCGFHIMIEVILPLWIIKPV